MRLRRRIQVALTAALLVATGCGASESVKEARRAAATPGETVPAAPGGGEAATPPPVEVRASAPEVETARPATGSSLKPSAAGPRNSTAGERTAPAPTSAAPKGGPVGPAGPNPGGGNETPGAADQPAPSAPERNTASDVGVTETTIKVGGYFILSGPLYDLAGRDPYRLWQSAIRYYNELGGVNGRRYVAVAMDSQGIDCGPAMGALRKGVEQDKVFAVAGSFNPYLTFCGGEYLERQGVPNFAGDTVAPAILKYRTTFGTATNHYRQARIAAGWATGNMGAASIVLVTHSDPVFDTVVNGLKEVAGSRLKQDERIAYDEANLAPLVQRLKAASPDVLVPYLNPDRNLLLLQEMERQGYRPPKGILAFPSMVLDLIPQNVGKYAEGMQGISWTGINDSPAPGMEEIKRAVSRYAPDAHIDLYSASGYGTFRLFHHIVRSLGANVTRQGLIAATNQLTNFDNAGLAPPLTYRPDNREANRCMQILVVRDGIWRSLHPWVCD